MRKNYQKPTADLFLSSTADIMTVSNLSTDRLWEDEVYED